MLRACLINLGVRWDRYLPVVEFAHNNSFQASIQMAPFEALYGRRCRSPIGWLEVGERKLLGTKLVQDATEKIRMIRQRMLSAQSRQKSYVDNRWRNLEFQVGDHVLLKVSPTKRVMRFCMKGKLSPRYIGPFEILERVGAMAYHLALQPELSNIHLVFYVSMLTKYNLNPSHVIRYETIQLKDDLNYKEQPVALLDLQVKKLRSKDVASIKVLWENHTSEEVMWEAEEEMRTKDAHELGEMRCPAMCTMWGDAHELGEMGCPAMCTMLGDAHGLGEMGCPAMCTMWGDAHELSEMGCPAMCMMWGYAHELDEM
ncbi:Uncharacterized protein TCM_017886 [Theobroma cacao]|uniref:Tf2-1-like SH3-like domain-containing protein n=1 Tax=Theobroma cacao TaxID=3641 RepID=A0A061EFT6_THECC|nr:Uncharacterized protein TCM_017886 [Theobroma cacao]